MISDSRGAALMELEGVPLNVRTNAMGNQDQHTVGESVLAARGGSRLEYTRLRWCSERAFAACLL